MGNTVFCFYFLIVGFAQFLTIELPVLLFISVQFFFSVILFFELISFRFGFFGFIFHGVGCTCVSTDTVRCTRWLGVLVC